MEQKSYHAADLSDCAFLSVIFFSTDWTTAEKRGYAAYYKKYWYHRLKFTVMKMDCTYKNEDDKLITLRDTT